MKMKILILVDSLKVGGGSDRVAAILGSELYSKGYDIKFLTLMDENPKYPFKGEYYTLNEHDIYGNNLNRIFKLLKYSPKIKKMCTELEIDTIISVGDPANFHGLISSWLFKNRVKIIISQHMNPEIFLKSKLKSALIKFFYPHADNTVCVSREVERILQEHFQVKNTLTIYNMMDLEENIELSLEKLPTKFKDYFQGNDNEYFNFINMGRLDRQKGQWFLIRSFRRVVDKHPHARLFLLGEGDLREELQALINKLDLEENVFLLGEQENIFPFLKNCHSFVLSSLWEGLPMSLIEALSLNMPVISTDCRTGPREILCPELDLDTKINYPYFGKYAILCQPLPNKLIFNSLIEVPLNRSEEILANLMVQMVEDAKLPQRYSNGLKIAGNFSKEKILTQWENLLKLA